MSSGDVMLVTMKFPVPSEAFCGVEVRALQRRGVNVRVRALLGKHKMHEVLLADWSIAPGASSTSGSAAVARGIAAIVRHPVAAIDLLCWLLRTSFRYPRCIMKSLVLIPRVMDLFAECRRHPPQVLYLYWGHYPSLLGYLVKRNLSQVRVSMNMGAYDLVFAYPYSIAFSRMADHVWTHARCNLEQLSAIGVDSSRVEVIYKGIDLSSSLMTQESSQKDWLRIVVVSRLSQNKGVDDAIRALWYVTRQLQIDIRMDVIGEGPDLQRLQELARDLDLLPRIRFLGPMRHQDVLSRLRAAGVFLLLSRSPSERLPNALKEAMAMGCISIVSRSPGIEEMTSWNDTLPPVAAGDWEEAGRQLCRVFSELSADELKSMRARGREVISADFDADGTALARMKRWRLPPTQYGSGVAC